MRQTLLAAAVLSALLAACGADQPAAPADATPPPPAAATPAAAQESEADRAFASLSKRFVDEGLALSPVYATGQGDHRHDAELDDLSPEGRAKALTWAKAMLADVQALDVSQ